MHFPLFKTQESKDGNSIKFLYSVYHKNNQMLEGQVVLKPMRRVGHLMLNVVKKQLKPRQHPINIDTVLGRRVSGHKTRKL
jgi:hypothetical protein